MEDTPFLTAILPEKDTHFQLLSSVSQSFVTDIIAVSHMLHHSMPFWQFFGKTKDPRG